MSRPDAALVQSPSNGSLLGALLITDAWLVGDAIAAIEPSFGAAAGAASFFSLSRLASTSSSVTETFAAGAVSAGLTAGAAMA